MTAPQVVVLATLDTKRAEARFLIEALATHGVSAATLDIGLHAGAVLDAEGKLAAMARAAESAAQRLLAIIAGGTRAVLAVGGGTGGEIALAVLAALPPLLPKLLVTTLPFDPRAALADNSLVIIPSLVDIAGLNPTLRHVLTSAAAMTAGLLAANGTPPDLAATPTIGITALGVTGDGVAHLQRLIAARGRESTVFHANGYGGATCARWADLGALEALIDYTPHELTRLELGGAHVPMPRRFNAAGEAGIPIVFVPGGLNLIGLGPVSALSATYRQRPHYAHSGLFTHVGVTPDEMVRCAHAILDRLNAARGPVHIVVPMGGFSSQDRPGGAVEQPAVRAAFLDTARRAASPHLRLTVLDGVHINDEGCARACVAALDDMTGERKDGCR